MFNRPLGLLALVALAGCGSDEPREVPWKLVGQDGRTLRLEVQAGGPPCDEIKPVEVDETPEVLGQVKKVQHLVSVER